MVHRPRGVKGHATRERRNATGCLRYPPGAGRAELPAVYAGYMTSLFGSAMSAVAIPEPSRRQTLWRDMAEGWAEFRSRTRLSVVTAQFAFFNV